MTEQTPPDLLDVAARHGFSRDAAEAAIAALQAGRGLQAQFSHPDLGGMGQWSQGGMLMIGDMFNHSLKAKVAGLFDELGPLTARIGASSGDAGSASERPGRWPNELGTPSSSGSQNDMHYAVFRDSCRLAVEKNGKVTVYDIGDRRITGVSQQQSHDQHLRFTGPDGTISTDDLSIVASGSDSLGSAAPNAAGQTPAAPAPEGELDIASRIDKLHALLTKGAMTQAEFDEAKRRLLEKL